MSNEVVIVGGARTPMAEYSGTPGFGKLKGVSAIDLAAHASKAAIERSKIAGTRRVVNGPYLGRCHGGKPLNAPLRRDSRVNNDGPPGWHIHLNRLKE